MFIPVWLSMVGGVLAAPLVVHAVPAVNGRNRFRLAAPPVEGAANAADYLPRFHTKRPNGWEADI
jgi:hypothetical protein